MTHATLITEKDRKRAILKLREHNAFIRLDAAIPTIAAHICTVNGLGCPTDRLQQGMIVQTFLERGARATVAVETPFTLLKPPSRAETLALERVRLARQGQSFTERLRK